MRTRLTPLTALTALALISATATAAPLNVFVNGAVTQPDVYELPAGSLIEDAIDAAGGYTPDADDRMVNLAQPLVDGMQIYVPTDGEESGDPPVISVPSGAPAGGSVPATGSPVNINTADAAALSALQLASSNPRVILENFYRKSRNAVEEGQVLARIEEGGVLLLGPARDVPEEMTLDKGLFFLPGKRPRIQFYVIICDSAMESH